MKSVVFLGSALSDLRDFPSEARRAMGFQIERVQRGLDPLDWKPMPSIGVGVREIRVRQANGAFRVIYVTVVADAVHVLHAFEKKSRATSRLDVELAAKRYRQLTRASP